MHFSLVDILPRFSGALEQSGINRSSGLREGDVSNNWWWGGYFGYICQEDPSLARVRPL